MGKTSNAVLIQRSPTQKTNHSNSLKIAFILVFAHGIVYHRQAREIIVGNAEESLIQGLGKSSLHFFAALFVSLFVWLLVGLSQFSMKMSKLCNRGQTFCQQTLRKV